MRLGKLEMLLLCKVHEVLQQQERDQEMLLILRTCEYLLLYRSLLGGQLKAFLSECSIY